MAHRSGIRSHWLLYIFDTPHMHWTGEPFGTAPGILGIRNLRLPLFFDTRMRLNAPSIVRG
ncbi:hypothetical protein BwSH20_72580 [Bradyrhizobium ottawaense]|nr:hypothetical protein BwSH20_72580 [Bradyrhizobium ottawaense]